MPFLTVVAGPNGSGKTTLLCYLRKSGVILGHYINADDIAKAFSLEGERGSRLAQQMADQLRDYYLEKTLDFSFETVMSHESKPLFMQRAKAAGYHVTLFFVCTDDPLKNVERVEFRVAHGGHSVPQDRVIARYQRSISLLPLALQNSDHAVRSTTVRNALQEWQKRCALS